MEANRRLALLIDGDNAQASLLPEMLAEVTRQGVLTIRRVYGDWTESNMKSWKAALHNHALQPVQQFRYTIGKNATDSALIIDAMDLLYTADLDGFCIVSSDSDYTRLATRIREKNLFVMGIGRQDTPRSFVSACDLFVYTNILQAAAERLPEPVSAAPEADAPQPATPKKSGGSKADTPLVEDLKTALRRALEQGSQEDGWVHLSTLGNLLRRNDPSFDPRTYGFPQLSQLVQAQSDWIESRKNDTQTQARLKPEAPKRTPRTRRKSAKAD